MKVLVVKSRMLRVLGTMAFISGAKWVKGKFGAALEFNGDGDQVLVAHNDALNIGFRIDIPSQRYEPIVANPTRWAE